MFNFLPHGYLSDDSEWNFPLYNFNLLSFLWTFLHLQGMVCKLKNNKDPRLFKYHNEKYAKILFLLCEVFLRHIVYITAYAKPNI